jgi:hypothetical protein
MFPVTSTTDDKFQEFKTALSQSSVAVEWRYKDIRHGVGAALRRHDASDGGSSRVILDRGYLWKEA